MPEPVRDPLIGASVGNYQVVGVLGKGGMGSVYELHHRQLGRRLALKALHSDFLSRRDIVERFFAEAQATNAVNHPGIVDITDTGTLDDGRPYLLMELLAGASLADTIRRRGALSTDRVVGVLSPVCQALDAAHAAGIYHRDLKPDNLFLCDDGRVVVLDFGIAKLTGALRRGDFPTRTGDLLGTPQYMAPEQASGQVRAIGPHTDVFALGAVAYEMLTGRPPYTGSDVAALVIESVTGTPPPISDLRPDLPTAWVAVIEKAMAKDSTDRFATAGELADAAQLANGAASRPLTSGPHEQTLMATPRAVANSSTAATVADKISPRGPTPRLPTPRLPAPQPDPAPHRGWWALAGLGLAATIVAAVIWLW